VIETEVIEIEEDITETRAEMGETLGEIGERLDPARLADQAGTAVREATIGRVEEAVETAGETAKGVTDMLVDTIRRNPIPAAMAGAGLLMLWRSRSQSTTDNNGQGSPLDAARRGVDSVGERAQDVTEGAGQLASDVATNARLTAGELGTQARRIMYEQPFVAGIAALGAGAALGALLPETQIEQDLIGEPSEALVSKAGEAANEVGERAEEAISTAAV
jgi:hypothetical protein